MKTVVCSSASQALHLASDYLENFRKEFGSNRVGSMKLNNQYEAYRLFLPTENILFTWMLPSTLTNHDLVAEWDTKSVWRLL